MKSFEKKLISKETAKEYIDLYRNGKYLKASKEIEKPDALEFFYTLDELEGYIAYVKEEAKKQGLSEPTGISFALSSYPNNVHVKEKQNGLTSIILRPYHSNLVLKSSNSKYNTIESISPMNLASSIPPPDNI